MPALDKGWMLYGSIRRSHSTGAMHSSPNADRSADYEAAAEALADAAEDLMYCEEDSPGQHLSLLEAAWERFARVADARKAKATPQDDA
jgi:hypothetical protein